MHLLLAMGF